MPLNDIYQLVNDAGSFWYGADKGRHRLECLSCGIVFYGRSNRRYCCKECKRDAEDVRQRLQLAIQMLRRAPAALQEAERNYDYPEKRLWLARREHATREFISLADNRVILADSDIEQLIDKIRRETAIK